MNVSWLLLRRASWLALPCIVNSDSGSCCGCAATRSSRARAPSPGGVCSAHAAWSVSTSARKSPFEALEVARDRVLGDVRFDGKRTRLERERDQQRQRSER